MKTAIWVGEPTSGSTGPIGHRAGLGPRTPDEIEIRGVPIDQVKRPFVRPKVVSWASINRFRGAKEL